MPNMLKKVSVHNSRVTAAAESELPSDNSNDVTPANDDAVAV